MADNDCKPDGGPAYPTDNGWTQKPGMTVRDYFAGQAFPMAWTEEREARGGDSAIGFSYEGIAKRAYAMADAMLEERVK